MEDVVLGCCIFDEPDLCAQGWLATGGEKTERFESVDEVLEHYPSSQWLTNVPYTVRKELGVMPQTQCCCAGYFHEDFVRLSASLGIQERRGMAIFGGMLMNRVTRLAKAFVDEAFFPAPYAVKFGFQRALGLSTLFVPGILNEAFTSATYYSIECPLAYEYPEKEHIGTLLVPQRTHCARIFDAPLPLGRFLPASRDEIPAQGAKREDIIAYLRDNRDRPGLFHIVWSNLDANVRPLLRFSRHFGDMPRELWLTSPDFMLLAPFADITIYEVYFAESVHHLDRLVSLAETFGEHADCSISSHLFFENLWLGQTVARKSRQRLPGLFAVNPNTSYLRARDRFVLFQSVANLIKNGITVLGYGNGRIRVDMSRTDPLRLFTIARENGLIPPFLGLQGDLLPKPSEETVLSYMQHWFATNNTAAILDFDGKMVNSLLAKSANLAGGKDEA